MKPTITSAEILHGWLWDRDAIPHLSPFDPGYRRPNAIELWDSRHIPVAVALLALRDEGQPTDFVTVADRLVEWGFDRHEAEMRLIDLLRWVLEMPPHLAN